MNILLRHILVIAVCGIAVYFLLMFLSTAPQWVSLACAVILIINLMARIWLKK